MRIEGSRRGFQVRTFPVGVNVRDRVSRVEHKFGDVLKITPSVILSKKDLPASRTFNVGFYTLTPTCLYLLCQQSGRLKTFRAVTFI